MAHLIKASTNLDPRNRTLHIYGFENLTLYIFLCQGENKNTLNRDLDDQDTIYVFTSKGTQVVYFNLNLHNMLNHSKQCTWRIS